MSKNFSHFLSKVQFFNRKEKLRIRHLFGFIPIFLVGLGLTFAIASCTPQSTDNTTNATNSPKADVELNLVSFSVTKAAYDNIIPKFVEKWQKENNKTIKIRQSYGASGSQALLVIEGREEADVVHLSLAPDVQKIEQAGLINEGWQEKFPHNSIVSQSVVAIATREGNPKGIKTWNDLAQKGVSVITPNPYTSGGGRWNFLALWNSGIHAGNDEAKTSEFVAKVYKNVPSLPGTARKATTEFFKQGIGDALITYENEVILKAQKGEKLPYIIPDVNFSIDNPIAIVDKNVEHHQTRQATEAFVQYLYSPEAQEEFAKIGYRPFDPTVSQIQAIADQYPPVQSLATVKDYGGWNKIQKEFFETNSLVSKIFKLVNT